MRNYICSLILAAVSLPLIAQTAKPKDGSAEVEKTIPVQKGQRISMRFDYPELVKVTTWEKNEVSVRADVDINDGQNNDAFVLEASVSGDIVKIDSRIDDMENIPHRITVWNEGEKIIFSDKNALKAYQKEQGKTFKSVSYGVDMNIVVEIFVPRNVETRIESIYGIVEVKGFDGPLEVEATYGAVDASVRERAVGEVVAETNYGEIFTNLQAKFSGDFPEHDFHTFVKATPGTGPKYALESKYGNVYIRRVEN